MPLLSTLSIEECGYALYEQLKVHLEPTYSGQSVAIHLDSGNYIVHPVRSCAVCQLFEKYPNGEIYAQVIGPPTTAETVLAALLSGGKP